MLCDSSSSDDSSDDEARQSLQFKVVLLGDAGAGKTCLMRRLVHGTFAPE
jgi:GTPase SAR1 family protein